MAKIKSKYIFILMWSSLLLFLLFFYTFIDKKIEKNILNPIIGEKNNKNNDIEINNSYDELISNINIDKINQLRSENNLDDITMFYINNEYNWNNSLLKLWKKFLDNLEWKNKVNFVDNINWGLNLRNLDDELKTIDNDLIRKFNLKLKAYDYSTKQLIEENAYIYVNWINIWEMQNWNFVWTFEWLKWIEKFNILLRSNNYWDWIITLNSLNSEWSLLKWDFYLKKAQIYDIDLSTEQNIDFWDFELWIDKCDIVTKNDECYDKIVKIKANFIDWGDANTWKISINMNAIDQEWELTYLKSGWMAFIDIIDSDGNILKIKDWKTLKITYHVSEDDIIRMDNNSYWSWDNNWYWWYDKIQWIWKKLEASITLDREKNIWTAEISKLY